MVHVPKVLQLHICKNSQLASDNADIETEGAGPEELVVVLSHATTHCIISKQLALSAPISIGSDQ